MTTLHYTKYNVFEIIDGGDGMLMVEGLVASSLDHAKAICTLIEQKQQAEAKAKQNEIWYCQH